MPESPLQAWIHRPFPRWPAIVPGLCGLSLGPAALLIADGGPYALLAAIGSWVACILAGLCMGWLSALKNERASFNAAIAAENEVSRADNHHH